MRNHCTVTLLTAAGLDHDHWFEPRGRPQTAQERASIRNTFYVQHYALGKRVESQVVQHLAKTHIGGSAQRCYSGKTKTP